MSNLGLMMSLFIMMMIAGAFGLAMLGSASQITVQRNAHAEVKHGTDALRARLAIYHCQPAYLKIYYRPDLNPVWAGEAGRWMAICPDSQIRLCAVMIIADVPTNAAMPECAAYLGPCDRAYMDAQSQGFLPAEVEVVRRMMEMLVTLEVQDDED